MHDVLFSLKCCVHDSGTRASHHSGIPKAVSVHVLARRARRDAAIETVERVHLGRACAVALHVLPSWA